MPFRFLNTQLLNKTSHVDGRPPSVNGETESDPLVMFRSEFAFTVLGFRDVDQRLPDSACQFFGCPLRVARSGEIEYPFAKLRLFV